MELLTKNEFLHNADSFKKKIEDGTVFIYPTDTIYGIGCNAQDDKAVARIRDMKQREDMPFSIIAPSKKWIYDNCEVSGEALRWIERLPGPYTFIFKLLNNSAVAENVHPGVDTIGVRIPNNWFTEFVAKLGMPVVSTSANITGEDYMKTADDLDEQLKAKLDFMIYEGEKKGRPSTLVKLYEERVEIVER